MIATILLLAGLATTQSDGPSPMKIDSLTPGGPSPSFSGRMGAAVAKSRERLHSALGPITNARSNNETRHILNPLRGSRILRSFQIAPPREQAAKFVPIDTYRKKNKPKMPKPEPLRVDNGKTSLGSMVRKVFNRS